MKKGIGSSGWMGLLMAVLPTYAIASVNVSKIENDSKIRVVICDEGLREGDKVVMAYTNSNQPLAPSVVASSSWGLKGDSVCAKRDLPVSSIPDGAALIATVGSRNITINLKPATPPPAPTQSPGVTITRDAAGNFTVRVCDSSLRSGSTVTFAIGENGLEQSISASGSCATKQYTAGLFAEGKKVYIRGVGVGALTMAMPASAGTVTSPGTRVPTTPPIPAPRPPAPQPMPQPVPQPNPGNGGVTPPPVDTRKVAPVQVIQGRARQSALKYVNAVVQSIGQIERIRMNFLDGVLTAQATVQAVMPNLNQSRGYQEGVEQARGQGTAPGFKEGVRAADVRSNELATADVSAAIDRAIQTGAAPQFNPRQDFSAELNSYNGARAALNPPTPLVDRMARADAQLQAQFRRKFVPYGDLILSDDWYRNTLHFTDLYTVTTYRNDLVLSRYRGEKAFQGWLNNDLRPSSDSSNVAFYNEIINADLYQNSENNRVLFAQTFIAEYDRLLNDAWNRQVSQKDSEISDAGRDFYLAAYNQLGKETGYNEQYQTEFQQASKVAFLDQLSQLYPRHFGDRVTQAQTSAFITDVSARLITAAGVDGNSVTMGDSFGVSFDAAVNKGSQSGQVGVSVRGLRQDASPTVTVAGYHRLDRPTQFLNVATLVDVTEPDQTFPVVLVVADRSFQFSVHATFEAAVTKLGTSSDVALKAQLLGKITGWLKSEWENKASRWGSPYDKHDGTLLIERLARVAQSSAQVKAGLRGYATDLKNTINGGKKPGFLSGHQGDFKSANEILRAAGIVD